MKLKIIVCLISLTTILLAGCAGTKPLKAPCDEYASSCGTKTKINQW